MCVIKYNSFIHLFSLLNLTNIPDASLNPIKVYEGTAVVILQIL